eukprot:6007725-Prymnesium_polylepis.1
MRAEEEADISEHLGRLREELNELLEEVRCELAEADEDASGRARIDATPRGASQLPASFRFRPAVCAMIETVSSWLCSSRPYRGRVGGQRDVSHKSDEYAFHPPADAPPARLVMLVTWSLFMGYAAL